MEWPNIRDIFRNDNYEARIILSERSKKRGMHCRQYTTAQLLIAASARKGGNVAGNDLFQGAL